MSSEKYIEQRLVKEVKKHGGICPKFIAQGIDGMPDRLILLPEGKMAFAELKTTGKKPRALRLARHRLLRKLGYKVYVIDRIEQIGGVIDEIQSP